MQTLVKAISMSSTFITPVQNMFMQFSNGYGTLKLNEHKENRKGSRPYSLKLRTFYKARQFNCHGKCAVL